MTRSRADFAVPPPTARADESCPGSVGERARELYAEHSSSLIRSLTRQTGCRETAIDLTHEAFERLLRSAPRHFFRLERPDAYLRRISTNLARDWGRSRAVAERASARLEPLCESQVDQIAILESRDTLRRLEAAVGKLKPRTREIFLAHRVHGLTYAEIAERTGLTVKGVEKQMGKAIAKIDRFLDRA